MKYSELDFKGGTIKWDSYKGHSEDLYFKTSYLDQDMLMISYEKYSIDLGWYSDRYSIMIVENDTEEWIPFYSVKVFKHEEIFDRLQEVINNAESYYNLRVFL